jgi:predicted nucleic acid-binding Zn ribbon protein
MQKLGLKERLRQSEVIDAWSSIVGEFIAAHSAPVALREGVLYVRVLQPSLHYKLERIAKTTILRKLRRASAGKPFATFGSVSVDKTTQRNIFFL